CIIMLLSGRLAFARKRGLVLCCCFDNKRVNPLRILTVDTAVLYLRQRPQRVPPFDGRVWFGPAARPCAAAGILSAKLPIPGRVALANDAALAVGGPMLHRRGHQHYLQAGAGQFVPHLLGDQLVEEGDSHAPYPAASNCVSLRCIQAALISIPAA